MCLTSTVRTRRSITVGNGGATRASSPGGWARTMAGSVANRGEERTVASAATYPKAHRTATGLGIEKGARSLDRSHRGRHERQVACHLADNQGRPPGSETRRKTKGDVPASPCIPGRKQREKPVEYHKRRDKRRNPYRDRIGGNRHQTVRPCISPTTAGSDVGASIKIRRPSDNTIPTRIADRV